MKLTNLTRNPFVIARTRPDEQEIILGHNQSTPLDDERFQRFRRSPVVAALLDRRLLIATRNEVAIDPDDPGDKVSEAKKPAELDVSNSNVDNGKRTVVVDSTPTQTEVPATTLSDAPAGGRRSSK